MRTNCIVRESDTSIPESLRLNREDRGLLIPACAGITAMIEAAECLYATLALLVVRFLPPIVFKFCKLPRRH